MKRCQMMIDRIRMDLDSLESSMMGDGYEDETQEEAQEEAPPEEAHVSSPKKAALVMLIKKKLAKQA